MPIQRVHQPSFSKGEIDPKLISRNDIEAYKAGLKRARNVVCMNQGPIERRPGTLHRATLGAETRLETFIFNQDQEYIFAFQNGTIKIYSTSGTLHQTISSTGIATAQLFEFNYTQQGDTMIIVHKDFNPKKIVRTGATTFALSEFAFDTSSNAEKVYQPYFKFADDSITLDINATVKGTTGVTCTVSSAYFTSDYVGKRIRYQGVELLITGYTSSTVVTATLQAPVEIFLDEDPFRSEADSGTIYVTHPQHGFTSGASITISGADPILDTDGNGLIAANINGTHTISVINDNEYSYVAGSSDTANESVDGGGVRVKIVGHPPTRSWDEQVFSSVNGFPQTAVFHEQRLFFAGSTGIPDMIVGSKVAAFYNFDVGQAEDNESVQIQIASDQINEIRHLVSGKVLQVLTSTSEFYLKPQTSKPITPTDIQVVRQSTLGSQLKAMPRIFNGATIYVQNNGKNVREYLFTSSTEEFVSDNISLLSSHLISNPVDSAKVTSLNNRTEQFYLLVNDDGTIAVYSAQRQEKLSGWWLWTSPTASGTFESVTCTTTGIYVVTKRTIDSSTVYSLEQFADTSFDLPTDMTTTKTLSGSYQPHGSVLVNGSVSSSNTLIVDGATVTPYVGEKFQFGGTGTEYTINSVKATGSSNEYVITINAAVSQSDNTTVIFTSSRVFYDLATYEGLTVYGTSGSTEGGNIYYYGSGTVSSGVVTFDEPASAMDIGLLYEIDIKTLPQDAQIQGGVLTGFPRKIGKSVIELSATYNILVNGNIIPIGTGPNDNTTGMQNFTGKKNVFTLGYSNEPNLEITQSVPLPMRILGITTEVYY